MYELFYDRPICNVMFTFSQEEEKKDNRVKGRGEEGAHDLMSSEVESIISRHHIHNYNHNLSHNNHDGSQEESHHTTFFSE